MENVNINGVDGVFLSNKEMDYIKSCIEHNNLLLIGLIMYMQELNNNNFDYLLNLPPKKKI